MSRVPALTALLMAIFMTGAAGATQHLVRPGENWEVVDGRLKPGDEIILLSGNHRPGTLRNAQGTAELPITMRGLDPENPPLIEADRYGIRLVDPRHVVISDLRITGATINGILIDGGAGASRAHDKATTPGRVTLTRLTVTANGPRNTDGQRHAIHLRHLEEVGIDSCRVEGWVGTGLEIVACRNVRVVASTFIGLPAFVQRSGIRARAGSDRVRIETSRFRNTGDQGVCIGARSKPDDFAALPEKDSGPRFEASRVHVQRCIFEDSLSAVAFVNTEHSFARNCTIVRPRRAVMSVRHEQKDPAFGGVHRCAFGNNLVVWEPGDLTMITHVGPDADASLLLIEQNLWWSPGLAGALEGLGGFVGEQAFPQIIDVDPGLDDAFRPTAEAAAGFGADPD